MTIKNILADLPNSEKPIARILHKGENFKVLAIGFTKSMVLAEHKANVPSKLMVISGNIIYKKGDQAQTLQLYDEHDIPVGELHALEATEDSICLLIQGK